MEKKKLKIFIIDIDGTICENIRNEEGIERMRNAKPYWDSIKKINELYDQGHYICFFTARTDEHKEVTIEWLKRHGVKYHQIIFNKPRKVDPYDEYHYIDDVHVRATTYKGKFSDFKLKQIYAEVFDD
ncbi:MAG: phosphoheptose isomerase [Thermoproteota archaeon]|jgi:hypothetical protein